MKTLFCCVTALILLAVPAAAQTNQPTIQPNDLNAGAQQKPPLQLSDQQRQKIQEALVTAHSAQKTTDKFEPKVGTKIPTALKLDAMPAPLINEEPVLKQYDFVKLENDLLVVDPMNSMEARIFAQRCTCKRADQRLRRMAEGEIASHKSRREIDLSLSVEGVEQSGEDSVRVGG